MREAHKTNDYLEKTTKERSTNQTGRYFWGIQLMFCHLSTQPTISLQNKITYFIIFALYML
jgi:hypothetical protein